MSVVRPANAMVVSRVLIYARVSTSEQVKSGTSLCQQVNICEEFARAKWPHCEILHFLDEGKSGTIPILEREKAREMTDYMEENDVIICTRLDRLSRNAKDLLATIPAFQDSRVLVYFCEQFGDMPVVYPNEKDNQGLRGRFDMNRIANEIMLMVLSAVAEIEHGTILDRFADGKMYWSKEGYSIGGPTPYGFRKVEEWHGHKRRVKLVEVEEEQKVLEQIYRLRDRGLGPRRICKQINSLFDVDFNHRKVQNILDRKFQAVRKVK